MNRAVAGIYEPSSADPAPMREAAVANALVGETATTVASWGPLTVGWTGPPPSAPAADGTGVAVLDGRLDDLATLSASLELPEELPPEVVLGRAYARWGEVVVDRLRGNFAVVLWDVQAEEGVVVVDQLGSKPLFYSAADSRLVFASEISILLRLLARRPPPDAAAVVQWLANGCLQLGQTLYDGVRRLEGGHLLALARGWERRRYWTLRYSSPLLHPRADLVRQLRSAITVAVERRIDEDGATGVLLSGGIDSSAIAAVASEVGRTRGGEVRAYSAVFPEYPSMDESGLIERVVNHVGIPSAQMSVRGGSLLAGPLEFLRRFELPCLTVNLVFSAPLERLAAADGVRVLLDGEGGDEVFGVSRYLIADRIARGRLLSAARLAARLPHVGDRPSRSRRAPLRRFGFVGAVPHRVHRLQRRIRGVRRPPWFTEESARLYAQSADPWIWKTYEGPRWWRHLADLLTVFRERLGAYDLLRHKAVLGGVELRHPFLHDLDLVELALRIPPELLFDPVVDRPLLRESLKGALPEEVRMQRRKSALGALFLDYLTGRDWPAVASVLGGERLELDGYLRPDVVHERFGSLPDRPDYPWAQGAWRLFNMECWLRLQADRSFPDRMLERFGLEEPSYERVGQPMPC